MYLCKRNSCTHISCRRMSERDVCIAHERMYTNTHKIVRKRDRKHREHTNAIKQKHIIHQSEIELFSLMWMWEAELMNRFECFASFEWSNFIEIRTYTLIPFEHNSFYVLFIIILLLLLLFHVVFIAIVYKIFDTSAVCLVTFACICNWNTLFDIESFNAFLLLLLLL